MPGDNHIGAYRMKIRRAVAEFIAFCHFVNVWNDPSCFNSVSMTSYAPRVAWNNNIASSTRIEMAIKIQVKYHFFLIQPTKAQPPSIVNAFNSQLCFQCTNKLNNIPETSQTNTAFCLSKRRKASQKLICLEFHAPIIRPQEAGLLKD